jgi:phenylacetate-CoA ligase
LLDPITTKAEDVLQLPDGRIISPSILTHPFKPFDQIIKSQVIQVALDHVLVKIVAGASFTPKHQAELVAGMQVRLGGDVRIEVELVDEIPPERSGKFRWVVSRVETPYSPPWDRLENAAPTVPTA